MKKIALISSFCDTEKKQNVLLENINILKENGVDVMCISPNFIELKYDIIKSSDFTFYTKENPILNWPERAFMFWKTIPTDKGWVKMTHFLNDYGWAALYQTKKLSEIALTFDYDIFYHMIYDTVLDNNLINEIKNNETNIIHPRRNPNNQDDLWETSLHFMIFDRELMKKIIKEITLDEYLSTNGTAEEEVLKWKNKFNISGSEYEVKDKIFLYEGEDFFNYTDELKCKIFFSKNQEKLKLIFYDISSDLKIQFIVNDTENNLDIKKGKNKLIETDFLCKDVYKLKIKTENKEIDLTNIYRDTKRNFLNYN